MAAYDEMYAILCKTIDFVIDPLNKIPLAVPYARILERALLRTEEIYCETATDDE